MKGFLFQIKLKVRRWGAELSGPVPSAEPCEQEKKIMEKIKECSMEPKQEVK